MNKQDKLLQSVLHDQYKAWRDDNYPKYAITLGVIFILWFISLITVAILIWCVTWWWKAALTLGVITFIGKVCIKLSIKSLVGEYEIYMLNKNKTY